MSRILVAGCLLFLSGCVAQVRGTRLQKPFTVVPANTKVALLSIDVPEWVQPLNKGENINAVVKAALVKSVGSSLLTLDDQTASGAKIMIGPKVRPIILPTLPGRADINQPWPVTAMAVGAPPITWKIVSGPQGLTINAETGVIQWNPRDLGVQKLKLVAVNPFGESPYDVDVNVQPMEKNKVAQGGPSAPVIAPEVEFGAKLPPSAPGDAQLLMGVQVVSAAMSTETMQGGATRKRVGTDVVYTLWTRDGREVETRRVELNGVPYASFRDTAKLVPARSSLMGMKDDKDGAAYAGSDETKLFAQTIDVSAAAFMFPFGERKVYFSAQLEEKNPALKPGLELSNKDDFEGAFKAFETVAIADPNAADAIYNMAVMREVQGRDDEALALYKKALLLKPDEGMYSRGLHALDDRMKERRVLELK